MGFGERSNDSVSPKKVEGIDEEVWVGLDIKKRVFLIPPEWNRESGRTPDIRYREEDINEKMVINGKQYTGGILNNYKNAYPLVDTKISEMVAGNQEGAAVKAEKAPSAETERQRHIAHALHGIERGLDTRTGIPTNDNTRLQGLLEEVSEGGKMSEIYKKSGVLMPRRMDYLHTKGKDPRTPKHPGQYLGINRKQKIKASTLPAPPVKEPEPEPAAVDKLHKGGGRKKYRKSKRRNSKRRKSKRRKSKNKTNKRRKRR